MLLAEETGWYNTPTQCLDRWCVNTKSMCLECGLTDLKRHRADAKMNATPVTIVSRDHATKLRHIHLEIL